MDIQAMVNVGMITQAQASEFAEKIKTLLAEMPLDTFITTVRGQLEHDPKQNIEYPTELLLGEAVTRLAAMIEHDHDFFKMMRIYGT